MTIPKIQKLLEQGCEHWGDWKDISIGGVFKNAEPSIVCKPCAAAAILELERVRNRIDIAIECIDKALETK